VSLPSQSIKKLLREHFVGETPMSVPPRKRKSLGKEILKRIKRFDHVKNRDGSHHASEAEKERLVCRFLINESSSDGYSHYDSNEFTVSTGDADELLLGEYSVKVTVASIDEIESFVLACLDRLRRRRTLAAKRQKVRDIKTQAVIIQVKNLAQELKFDFMTEADQQKLKLYVKLSDVDAVMLAIPFKHFEQVLPKLRTMISTLRELYDTGIRFKLTSAYMGYRANWISYKGKKSHGNAH
jgi:hypothetical protein